MNIKLLHLALCSSVSFFAGLLLATGGFRGDAAKTLGIAGLSALPIGFIAYITTDSKAANKLRKAEREASEYQIKLSSSERLYSDCEAKLADVNQQSEQLKINSSRLTEELAKSREMLAVSESGRNMLADSINSLQARESELLVKLEAISRDSASEINHLQSRVNELTTEIEEYNQHFDDCVQSEADKKANELFQTAKVAELEKIYQQHDAINQRAIKALDVLKAWGFKAISLSHQKHDDAMSYARQYNEHIDEFSERVNKERSALLEQLEACNLRVLLLQREVNGDLVEPQYGDFGFDVNGKVANAIAREVFTDLGIPLAVKGFHVKSDGAVDVGYGYSRSIQPQALVEALTNHSANIAKRLGIHKIVGTRKLEITDCVVVSYRVEPPKRVSSESLYRSQAEFIKLLLSSRLFFRIVGSPGTGKTPSLMVVLSHILKRGFLSGNEPDGMKLNHTQVDFCNPLEGISAKNGDETAIFHRWSDPEKALDDLRDEYKFRKDSANKLYKDSVGYLWCCDEFNNAVSVMTKSDLKTFMQMLRDGGHTNMGAIILGQDVMVTKSVFGIEDQKFFTNIFLDSDTIRTFLLNYGDTFVGQSKVETALKTLELIELEIDEVNNSISDTARKLRIAMVITKRSPVFYMLPYFDSVEVDRDAYLESRKQVAQLRDGQGRISASPTVLQFRQSSDTASVSQKTDTDGQTPMSAFGTDAQTVLKPNCPHCGSSKVRSKANKWVCENLDHSNIAPNTAKSWKK